MKVTFLVLLFSISALFLVSQGKPVAEEVDDLVLLEEIDSADELDKRTAEYNEEDDDEEDDLRFVRSNKGYYRYGG
ncbi:hypothetical protein GBAR_LOCUS21628, partial [Geodia barretti]